MPTLPFTKLQNSITELVNSYREAYRHTMLSELPEMTFRQFIYLEAIIRMDNPTYGEVAERFKVTKPAVSAIVTKLIRLGYLERVQSGEDRRVYHLSASEQGKNILAVETKTAAEYGMSAAACLTQEEQEQFVRIVAKIIASSKPDCR